VTATGTVNPIVTVQVGAQVSGTIQALGADFNSVVQPGQMMAQIDPRLFKAAVLQAEANLRSAGANVLQIRAQLANARKLAARNRNLLKEKFVAQQDVDATDTAADAYAAQLKAAQAVAAQAAAALATARTNLAYTTIRSPVKGIVITRNIDVGETVAAAFAAPTLFLVGEDLTKLQVDTNIAEADVGRLAPGMTANIEIVYAERASVLRIANAAIRFRAAPELAGKAPPHCSDRSEPMEGPLIGLRGVTKIYTLGEVEHQPTPVGPGIEGARRFLIHSAAVGTFPKQWAFAAVFLSQVDG
jgi:HlyD family secretion protein